MRELLTPALWACADPEAVEAKATNTAKANADDTLVVGFGALAAGGPARSGWTDGRLSEAGAESEPVGAALGNFANLRRRWAAHSPPPSFLRMRVADAARMLSEYDLLKAASAARALSA